MNKFFLIISLIVLSLMTYAQELQIYKTDNTVITISLSEIDSISFTQPTVNLPVVSTNAVNNITQNSAVCGGNVTSEGASSVIERGVCWSTSQYPSTANEHTVDGSGAGSFSSNITGLNANTLYYVSAYATNDDGTSYGAQISFTTSNSTTIEIGDIYAGGIVFYVDITGEHGLVCPDIDQTAGEQWGCKDTYINGADGTGAQNTIDIVNDCSTTDIAARICDELILYGYNDWFLPSKDELNLMYINLHLAGIGSFYDEDYWTSSEQSDYSSWLQDVGDGDQTTENKDYNNRVRAVRAF